MEKNDSIISIISAVADGDYMLAVDSLENLLTETSMTGLYYHMSLITKHMELHYEEFIPSMNWIVFGIVVERCELFK